MNENYGLELYKSLRQEQIAYLEKVPSIWLQKFTLTGAMIAFIVINAHLLENHVSREFLAAAYVAVPILAALLDAKATEYSLHARAISMFIHNTFKDPSDLAAWESTLWGDAGDRQTMKVVRLRSRMTSIVTVAPTLLLLALALASLAHMFGNIPIPYLGVLSTILIAYILGGVYIYRLMWPHTRRRSPESE